MTNIRHTKYLAFLLVWLLPCTASAVTISLSSIAEGGNSAAFTGLLLEPVAKPNVGVVLLHGRNGNADGTVVSELRNSINTQGYTTLSIDEPVPAAGTAFSDYVNDVNGANTVFPELYARVRTAINELANRGIDEVVLLGFSLGARMASAHVARGQVDELPIIGMIGVGMFGNSIDPLNAALTLDEIDVPVLDIFGDNDANAVNTAAARLTAYNSGSGTNYTQTMVECVDPALNCVPHNFFGYRGAGNPVLESEVNTWLSLNAPLSAVPVPAAVWLFGSGLIGLLGFARRKA
ncbi:MAG TPA: DUF3530 family protein [Gammaproteobacteria bacterium]|nr:DUF3530 family protein [Gammaproteobacteria bacterium]